MMMNSNNGNINSMGQFGDTTLTKVFVGGLAWETQKETMREHFEKYGEILEAVIISDKVTGRSKGYGFVTFKEAEAAKKACEDATPVINGRRANCNLASLGARRPRSNSSSSIPQTQGARLEQQQQPQQGSNAGPRSTSSAPATPVQWYYPARTPASPYHNHHQLNHQAVPFYGYSPAYIAADFGYNPKLSYTGGSYVNGAHYSPQVYPGGQGMVNAANTVMPVYPFYHFHQSQPMGVHAHMFPPTTAGPITTVPTLISKPPAMAPNAVCLTVE
ncbi:probable RNA-binding protein ARP1 isoform X1 [Telopea speciosissima]|uniref:probable RNA-binding protein ARP1 isoform X1 n=1 Tax=Telopea speciosissima TaxID=54955 RepID=UPI001CC36777|nr:probable RNA-binding protein ARP1 isoform X1 [Telopea speciosissima]